VLQARDGDAVAPLSATRSVTVRVTDVDDVVVESVDAADSQPAALAALSLVGASQANASEAV